MGQSAKPERQSVNKFANVTFLTFIASKSSGTLRSKRPDTSFINLHKVTTNSQVICFIALIHFQHLTIYS